MVVITQLQSNNAINEPNTKTVYYYNMSNNKGCYLNNHS